MDNNNNLSESKSKPLSFKKSLKKARIGLINLLLYQLNYFL